MSSVEVRGKIVQVIGTVVDFRFPPDQLPPINGAIYVTNPAINDKPENLILEVAQHVCDNTVRCIAMNTTDGLIAARMPSTRAGRYRSPSARRSWAGCSMSSAIPWTTREMSRRP